MFGFSEILFQISDYLGLAISRLPLFSNGLGFLFSLSTLYALKVSDLRLEVQLRVGQAYLLVTAVILSVGEAAEGTFGLTRLVLLTSVIPLVLPIGPVRVVGYATLAVATQPLAHLWLVQLGFPSWSWHQLWVSIASDTLAVAASILPALTVADLNQKALQTFELGSYRLSHRLAEGGMGEVWVAQHKLLEAPAAIKLIKQTSLDEAERRRTSEKFCREAQALASLKSPHTVRVLDFGQDGHENHYLAMELLEGMDLDNFVRTFGAMPSARVVELLIQACRSLEEAHAMELTHCDIKPANLFLSHLAREDCLKILDFGLVNYRSKDTVGTDQPESQLIGTPEYMAPEVIRGERAEPRSDLYSLGCVAFWLLTGQEVFAGKSCWEVMTAHQQQLPPRPSWRTEAEISRELDLLVERCLQKDPEQRPQSARLLREALEACRSFNNWSSEQSEVWWSDFVRQKGPAIGAQ